MKKHSKLLFVCACGMLLAACGGTHSTGLSSRSDESSTSHTGGFTSQSVEPSSSEENWEEKSAKAMENFAAKLVKGNYNIASDNLTTNVVSENLIFFDSADGKGNDVAAMSVGNETFQARTDMGGDIEHVIFVDKGTAIMVAESQLPSYWFDEEALGKDIWDMVEMTQPNDGGFGYLVNTSDYTIRDSVAAWMGLADFEVHALEVVSLELDGEDPTKMTIKGRYSDGTALPTDVTVTINLGQAQSNEVAERWMANPNRAMPADVKDAGVWDATPLVVIDSILMLVNADEAMAWVPFMDFASYAVWTNMNTALQNHYGIIRDYHGTITNVEQYKETLIRENFTLKLNEHNEPVYRKVIRAEEDKACYVNIEVNYDHGFEIKFYLTYDVYHYNTRKDLNALISPKGFPEFPDTQAVHGWFGEDDFFVQTENWSYFYNYDVYAVTNLKYDDLNAATAYVEAYGKSLEALGFTRGKNSEINHWTYIDANVEMKFKYDFDGQGGLRIICDRNLYADSAKMKEVIEGAGYPEIDLTSAKIVTTQDHKKFQHFYYAMECDAAYRNTFYFDDNNEAKKFVGQYTQAILDAGFQLIEGSPYYMKDNLVFQPNDAVGGMCGLYFFILPPQQA